MKKVYEIECEWEMPLANGLFESREKAQEAINNEDWESYVEYTLEEVQNGRFVYIIEREVK